MHIQKGIQILERAKAKPAIAQGYLYSGELYLDHQENENALENLKKAEIMFTEMEMDFWLNRTREFLARLG